MNSSKETTFIKIHPFDNKHPLDREVISDHAGIGLTLPDGNVLYAENQNNPKYRPYFGKYGLPFKETHLHFEGDPYEGGKLNEGLAKIERGKMDDIVNNFGKKYHVMVIIEGYREFYQQLEGELKARKRRFKIIMKAENNDKECICSPDRGNITAILIDTSHYSIIEEDIYYVTYNEGSVNKEMTIPIAHIRNDKIGDYTLAEYLIMGLHIPGCESQYPASGLTLVADKMAQLFIKNDKEVPLIAIGDFNTPPMNTTFNIVSRCTDKYNLKNVIQLQSSYLTHVNPQSLASKYDQMVLIKPESKEYNKGNYKVLELKDISKASQKLVASIDRNVMRK